MSLLLKLKQNVAAITVIATSMAALVLMPIHFDERYAHAGDLRAIQEINRQQTQSLKATVTQQQLNWLEYYNDKILILERELSRDPNRADQIRREIQDVKLRKQFLEKSLIEQTSTTVSDR